MGIMRTLTINGTKFNVVPVVPATSVTLLASAWAGGEDAYSQVVELAGVTANTKVDLQPTAEQLQEFHYKVLGFVAENEAGVVTVYSIGDKPTSDHIIQVTLTEVEGTGRIRGNTVGTTMPRANLEQEDPTKADYVVGRVAESKLADDVADKLYGGGIYIDATRYGAVGDGFTDNAPALNALIQRVSSAGGGTIYLPKGTYMLDSSLIWTSNVSLTGAGVGLSIIKPRKPNASDKDFSAISYNTDVSIDVARFNPMVNCNFSHFTIDGEEMNVQTYSFNPKGIFILCMKDCTFTDLSIKNTGATGLGIDFMQNVVISRVHCYNCGRAYVPTEEEKVVGGAGIGIATMAMPMESCIITDCIAENCGNYGIFIEGCDGDKLYADENGNILSESHYTISNCQCINGRNYGIIVKGTQNVMVSNNICRGNARDGILVTNRWATYSKNVSVVGNQCVDNGYGEYGGCGIRLYDNLGNSSNVHVANNFLHGNKIGIHVASRMDNLHITNNIISNCEDTGLVSYRGNCKDLVVKNNVYVNNTKDVNCQTLFYGSVDEDNELCNVISMLPYSTNDGYYDSSGVLTPKSKTLTTVDMFAMNGHLRVGIKVPTKFYPTSGNLYVGVVWYDANKEFISCSGGKPADKEITNGDFMYFLNPNDSDAAYARIRVGYTDSTDDNYIRAFENTIINIC